MRTFNYKFAHKLNYIDWYKESKLFIVTNSELASIIDNIKISRDRINYTTKRVCYGDKNYSVRKVKDNIILNYWDKKNGYITYSTNSYDNSKNVQRKEVVYQGARAIKLVTDRFSENTGMTLKTAFGTVEKDFKKCVPKQFYFINDNLLNRQLNLSSADFNSHYPACMRGRLPDSHSAKTLEGTIKPSKEYPFAFYLKSGHCAEYEVFDTHEWAISKFMPYLFRFETKLKSQKEFIFEAVKPEEDITILMKASNYELTEVYEYFYEIKNTYPKDTKLYTESKLVLNASIGMLHTKVYNKYHYAHLAAVCLCRANQKMLNIAENMNINNIAQICVDGIIYAGDPLADNNRKLGEISQEFSYIPTIISDTNKYIAMKDGKVIKYKCGNCNKTKDGYPIEEKDIKSLKDQYNWVLVDPLKEYKFDE